MKEYWVNVYKGNGLGAHYNTAQLAARIFTSETKYRLHIREFETREAKELYLKMKYGRIIKYHFDYAKLKPLLNYGKSSMHEWMNQ